MKYQHFYLGVTLLLFLVGCDVSVTDNPEGQLGTAVQSDASSQEATASGSSKSITLENGLAIARESMRLLDSALQVPNVAPTQDGASVSTPNAGLGRNIVDGTTRTYKFDQFASTSLGEEVLLSGEYDVSENAGVTTLKGENLKITNTQGEIALSAFKIVTDRNGAEPTRIAALNADFSRFDRQVTIQIDPAFSGNNAMCPIRGNMKIRADDGSYVVVIAVPGGNLLLNINGEYITLSCGELTDSSGSGATSNDDSSSASPSGGSTPADTGSSEAPSTEADSSASDSSATGEPETPPAEAASDGSSSGEASSSSASSEDSSSVTVSISSCSNLLIEIKGEDVTITCSDSAETGTGTGSGGTGSGGTGSGITPPTGPSSDDSGSGGTGSGGLAPPSAP
ncbi:MAG: hypothetical protein DSZ28_05700 [Thiothrix sp.]|nr:MAG: hypothetical protein DSZ28_05700 [Thiothrix sp.]